MRRLNGERGSRLSSIASSTTSNGTNTIAAISTTSTGPPAAYPTVPITGTAAAKHLAGRPAFTQFSEMLRQMYPAWFAAPSGQDPHWFPDHLAFRFIEAAIAELTSRGETADTPNDAAEIALLNLVDYLDSGESRLACARRVSHLMTADRKELTIAEVTILEYRQFQETRQIAEVIPTAQSAYNGERPHSFAPPEATLVSYTAGPDPFALARDAERPIDRLLLALRLLYGTTTADVYQVTGEVTSVCRYAATLEEIPHDFHPVPVRPAVVSASTAGPVEKLLAVYNSIEHRTEKEVVHGLEMAVIKFTSSFAPRPWFEKIVDLATALEAALSGTDKADVTLRICTRAAIILQTDTDPAQAIFADVKALYDLRSSLVHGAIITQKQLEKWLTAVSTVPAPGDGTPRMRNEQLIDRLRDLVRRSILMRLLLNSDGRWPLRADPPPVDQLWTDPAVAEHWRSAWHEGAADLGAPEAAQQAVPLRDSNFNDYPGKTT
jgi:Apea-like HEPN